MRVLSVTGASRPCRDQLGAFVDGEVDQKAGLLTCSRRPPLPSLADPSLCRALNISSSCLPPGFAAAVPCLEHVPTASLRQPLLTQASVRLSRCRGTCPGGSMSLLCPVSIMTHFLPLLSSEHWPWSEITSLTMTMSVGTRWAVSRRKRGLVCVAGWSVPGPGRRCLLAGAGGRA